MEERTVSFLFSNSLCSNENNLIYIHKQLGNKGKPKFSASRAVFLCNMLRGNKVAIFLSKIYLYLYNLMQLYPTNATYFGNSLWQFSMAILMVVATLAKNLRPLYQNSVTLLTIGKPRAVDNMASLFWGWHFKSSVCVCWALIGNNATKLYTM